MRYANKISAFRVVLIPFFIASLIYYNQENNYLRYVALLIFSLAVISDAVDGIVARLNKEKTTIGPLLDPLADKLLLMSAYIFLFVRSPVFIVKLPIWVVLIVISRDAIILLGTFLIFIIRQDIKIIPSAWGKMTTFFQMITVIVLLLEFKYSFIFWDCAVLFTLISGIDYIRRGLGLLTFNDKNI